MRKEERRKRIRIGFMCTCVLVTCLLKRRVSRLVDDPSLEKDVDKEDGQERQDGGSQDQSLIGGMLGLEPDEQKRDRAILGRGKDNERPEIVIPGRHEGEDPER